jgi:hypothetical protein
MLSGEKKMGSRENWTIEVYFPVKRKVLLLAEERDSFSR